MKWAGEKTRQGTIRKTNAQANQLTDRPIGRQMHICAHWLAKKAKAVTRKQVCEAHWLLLFIPASIDPRSRSLSRCNESPFPACTPLGRSHVSADNNTHAPTTTPTPTHPRAWMQIYQHKQVCITWSKRVAVAKKGESEWGDAIKLPVRIMGPLLSSSKRPQLKDSDWCWRLYPHTQ